MFIILLPIVIAIVLTLVFDTLRPAIISRFPYLQRPLAQFGRFGKTTFLVCSIVGAVWIINKLPSQVKSIPDDIHPPTLNQSKWTVYDSDDEDNSESSLALPAIIDENGNAEVWNRFDDKETGETTLTLTKYDCDQESLTESLNVYFKQGAYDGFENLDGTDKIKVDSGTPDGAGYLLACRGIKPSSI